MQLHAEELLDLSEVLELAGRTTEARDAPEKGVDLYEQKGADALIENAHARFRDISSTLALPR